MRIVDPVPCLVLMTGGARAAGGEAALTGRATIGVEERALTLRMSCDPAGPGLSAVLTVPRFEDLKRRFDFDGLEGPRAAQRR